MTHHPSPQRMFNFLWTVLTPLRKNNLRTKRTYTKSIRQNTDIYCCKHHILSEACISVWLACRSWIALLRGRCSDEVNPRKAPYKISNQRLRELGLEFTPAAQALYETVICFQDKGVLPVSVDQLRWYVQQQRRWPHCFSTKEAITEAVLAIARELYQTHYIIACSMHTGTIIYLSGLCGVSNCACRCGVRQHA